ncbi:MAG: SRPBCC family protein [Schleiferiaceae bacterium]|nr:SRPBCC family protein [Schleiferiaceae bacterium]MDR9442936.1 SRPBCC family protein [Schleiferiaceae bacterium]
MYQFRSSQYLPLPPEAVWAFFADPANLPRLTPPHMKPRLREAPPPKMEAGMVVRLQVRPLLGIPLPFTSEITVVEPPTRFVDELRQGPFAAWQHEHHFAPEGAGTRLTDTVHYALPLGFVGKLFHPWLVKGEIEKLFAYRHQATEQLLNPPNPQ